MYCWYGIAITQFLQSILQLAVNLAPPHGDWVANTSSNNYPFYKKCGLVLLNTSKNGTYGYMQACKGCNTHGSKQQVFN